METQSGLTRTLTERLVSRKERKEHRLSKASIGQPMKINDKKNEKTEADGAPTLVMKCVVVQKDENGYGLTVSGDNPVYVQSVKPDGAAHKAGVTQGDRIIKVNNTNVTDCNHVDVVRLIKAKSYVALTLLGIPKLSSVTNTNDVESNQVTHPPPVNEYITGPKGQLKEFYDQKVETIKKMLEQEVTEVERIKEEYAKNPSPKLLTDLGTAQKLKQDLEKQLWKVESKKGQPQVAEQPPVISPPTHVTDVDDTTSVDIEDETPPSIDMDIGSSLFHLEERDPSTREYRSQTVSEVSLSRQSGLDVSNSSLMGSEENSNMNLMGGMPFDLVNHNDVAKPTTPVPEQNRTIMNFEDEDIAKDELTVKDHGPFNDFDKLTQRPAHLAVFLKYVIQSHDPSNLLFFLTVDNYRLLSSAKEMAKQAEIIHKHYLAPNAPLRVEVDDAITKSIQSTIHVKNPAEEILRGVFDPAVQVSNKEIRNQLSQYRIKREQGLGNLFGDEKLDNIGLGDAQQDARIVEDIVMPLINDINASSWEESEQAKWLLIQDTIAAFVNKYIGKRSKSKITSKVYSMLKTNKSQQPALAKSKAYGSQESIIDDGNKRSSVFLNWKRKTPRSNDPAADGKKHQDRRDRESKKSGKSRETIWENPPLGSTILMPTKVNPPTSPEQNVLSTSVDSSVELSVFDKQDGLLSEKQHSTKSSVKSNHSPVRPSNIPTEELQRAEELHTGVFDTAAAHQTFMEQTPSELFPEHGTVNHLINQFQDVTSGENAPEVDTLSVENSSRDGTKLRSSRPGSFRRRREDEKRHSGQAKSHSDPDKNKIEQAMSQHISSNENLPPTRGIAEQTTQAEELKETVIIPGPSVIGDAEINVDASEQHWSETVPSSAIKGIDRREVKRQEVINELIYTEQHHVRDLKILEKVFYEPMKKQGLMKEEEIFQAFPNLQAVLEIHRVFNKSLQEAKEEAKERGSYIVKNIGDILLSRFDGSDGNRLKEECALYCGNQSTILSMIKEKSKKEQKFNQFLEDMQKQQVCRKLHLKDFVPMEFQRLTKYPMLLENVIKYTKKKADGELEKIKKACERCRDILAFVNQTVKEAEDKQKILEIQQNLDRGPLLKNSLNDDPLVREYKNIDLTKRHVVHHGQLTWRVSHLDKKKEIPLHCILFEDLMVLLQRQEDRYILKCQMSGLANAPPFLKLDKLIVRNVATDKRGFFAMSTHAGPLMYEFVCKSTTDVKQWMKNITETVAVAKKDIGTSARRKGFHVAGTSRDVEDDNFGTISAGMLVGRVQENHPHIRATESSPAGTDDATTPVVISGYGKVADEILPVTVAERLLLVQQDITSAVERKHRLLAEASGLDDAVLENVLEMSSVDSEPEAKTLVMHSLLCVDKLTKLLNDCMVPDQIDVRPRYLTANDRERSASNRSSAFVPEQSEPETQERWAVPVSHPHDVSPHTSTATLNSVSDMTPSGSVSKSLSDDSFTSPVMLKSPGSRTNEEGTTSDNEVYNDQSDNTFSNDIEDDRKDTPTMTGDELSLNESRAAMLAVGSITDESNSRPMSSSYELMSNAGVVSITRMVEITSCLQTQLTQLMHVNDINDAEKQRLAKENEQLRAQMNQLLQPEENPAPPSYSDVVEGR
uniref:Uncharacterized protein LOC100177579 n=1 Tax=Phallusia mammillata TaxID=59560 RepID=A0A6F9DHL3_9ASCI|nr:uncharacterized protein LOC100177579 [Phallusia mammillata]